MCRHAFQHLRRNLVAYLALLVALSGTSYAATKLPANSVGSKQIINRSVQKVDLNKKTVVALRGQRGPRGLQGQQGVKGDKGDIGAKGDPGTPATKLFVYITYSGALSSVNQGATAVSHPSIGNYTVTFNRSLQGCVALAHIGIIASIGGGFDQRTFADPVIKATPATDVSVALYRSTDGAAVNGSFFLVVFC
jgi:hypothetical protein